MSTDDTALCLTETSGVASSKMRKAAAVCSMRRVSSSDRPHRSPRSRYVISLSADRGTWDVMLNAYIAWREARRVGLGKCKIFGLQQFVAVRSAEQRMKTHSFPRSCHEITDWTKNPGA